MSILFNADTSDGLKITSDNSGEILFQSAGVTKGGVNTTGLTGDGSQLTGIPATTNASLLVSGTLPDARFPATLPAVSGANLTGIGGGTPTLLTTLNTTSGTELTTDTLNLTTYKTIYVKITNIGQGTNLGSNLQWKNNGGTYQDLLPAASDTAESGHAYIICRPAELIPNYYSWTDPWGTRGRDWNIAVGGSPGYKYTTAMMILPSTTSISFKWASGQTFNLGQILIYGQT